MISMSIFRPGARKAMRGFVAAALLSGGWMLPACSTRSGAESAQGESSDVLATIGERKVTRGEVADEAHSGLQQAEMQKVQCESNYQRTVHQVMESTLKKVVHDRLLGAEAESRGISQEALVEAEVDAKLGEVTEAQIDEFYTANQAQIRQPKENVVAQIRQHLIRQQRDQAYEAFIDSLETKHDVDYGLGPYRVQVAADGASKGPDSAPVTIVEFSDFQCPYCSRVVPSLKRIEEAYGDKVQLVFRHFPLSFHQQAQKASEAALCAGDQGKFWEMHDLMFQEQQALQLADLKDKARRLELDGEEFASCLDSNKYYEQIQEDIRDGVQAGVSGTPAMFINGRFLSGAQPYEQIAAVIDEELEERAE